MKREWTVFGFMSKTIGLLFLYGFTHFTGMIIAAMIVSFGCAEDTELLCPLGERKVVDDDGNQGCEPISTALDDLKQCQADISPPLSAPDAVEVCCANYPEAELDSICDRDEKTPLVNFEECLLALAPIVGSVDAAVQCCVVWEFDPAVLLRCGTGLP
jgi:hypothetical protein